MAPTMYAMIKATPFLIPIDPGPTPAYNTAIFQTTVQTKIAEQLWDNDRRYYLSYENIHRACFRLLDEIVCPEFKVSNLPGLHGWNSTMTIQAILSQLETTFGRPSATVLFQNNASFTAPFSPVDTLESLFQWIEECQQSLGGRHIRTPRSSEQQCTCSCSQTSSPLKSSKRGRPSHQKHGPR
jgi:hypothetical protein